MIQYDPLETVLGRVYAHQQRYQTAQALERERRALRDEAIRHAAAAGAPYEQIAAEAHITKGRVSQIVASFR